MELSFGFVCDRGLNPRRPVNQDRVLAVPERGLFAVFDGVGGQRAGEVASQTAAETIEESLANTSPNAHPDLRRVLEFANRDIYELATTNPEFRSMATTVALVHLEGGRATIAHVGDSRVYRLQDGTFSRETIDHTDLNDELRAGRLSETEAGRDDGNVINRALGVEPDVEVEIKSIDVNEGARFLLCSDGIYKHLEDEQIAHELRRNKDPQRAAEELKRLVYAAGADDNLSAVIVEVGATPARKMRPASRATSDASAISASASRSSATRRPGRIRVDFSAAPGLSRTESSAEGYEDRDRLYVDPHDGPASVHRPFTRYLTFILLSLVLMVGAFYGGLLASDRLRKGSSNARGAVTVPDQLRAGREALDAGDYQTAGAQFDAVLRREPANAEAHYWLGRTQLEAGRYKEAAQSFERAIELHSTMRDLYMQAAAAYEAHGNRDKAERMLRQYGEERRKADTLTREREAPPRSERSQ